MLYIYLINKYKYTYIKYMFAVPAHVVLHCSISVLQLRQHDLFLSGMRGLSQTGFVLYWYHLQTDMFVSSQAESESDVFTLTTHT